MLHCWRVYAIRASSGNGMRRAMATRASDPRTPSTHGGRDSESVHPRRFGWEGQIRTADNEIQSLVFYR